MSPLGRHDPADFSTHGLCLRHPSPYFRVFPQSDLKVQPLPLNEVRRTAPANEGVVQGESPRGDTATLRGLHDDGNAIARFDAACQISIAVRSNTVWLTCHSRETSTSAPASTRRVRFCRMNQRRPSIVLKTCWRPVWQSLRHCRPVSESGVMIGPRVDKPLPELCCAKLRHDEDFSEVGKAGHRLIRTTNQDPDLDRARSRERALETAAAKLPHLTSALLRRMSASLLRTSSTSIAGACCLLR